MTKEEADLFEAVFDVMRVNTMQRDERMVLLMLGFELRDQLVERGEFPEKLERLNIALAPFEQHRSVN